MGSEMCIRDRRKGIVITRVTKISKHHAVIEDIAFSMADDLEAMGVHVNNVRIDCVPDYGDYDKSQRDAAGPTYEPFPYWKTGPKELGELSVGIGLYFQSLLWGQRVMLGMFFLGFFTVCFCFFLFIIVVLIFFVFFLGIFLFFFVLLNLLFLFLPLCFSYLFRFLFFLCLLFSFCFLLF